MANDTQEQFLKELEKEGTADILEAPIIPEQEMKLEEKEPEPKNRRERRLEAKLQAERESSIALAARLDAITEAQKARQDETEEAYLKAVDKIYGTATPETAEATELLKNALKGVREDAMRQAVEAFQAERKDEEGAVAKEEDALDSILESLEDKHNVDLTSENAKNLRTGFFTLLERMSPKDSDGNIIEYADPEAVYEVLQDRLKRTDNRAKDLSSRSMTQSGSSTVKTEDDAAVKFLKEHGII